MDFTSNILHIDRKYELTLTMSWTPDGAHGMSGHIFELIEYYYVLSQHFKVCILICENFTHDDIKNICNTKYNFTETEIQNIINNTILSTKPTIVRGRNLLVVDGNMTRSFVRYGVKLIFRNIIAFRCSPMDTFWDLPYKNVSLLQDQRVYDDRDREHAINYKKKILLSKYKHLNTCNRSNNIGMFYLTSNCRKLAGDYLRSIMMDGICDEYIVLTNQPERYITYTSDLPVTYPKMPVSDIFNKFDTYIYTKTDRVLNPNCGCFDCSPRFIAECKHYNKTVIYKDIDETYLSIDTGLKYRRHDIESDYESIQLLDDDKIVDIVRSIIHVT